ncbi:hypothetical protein RB195_011500 [Necator americanus]|uniref:Uncharacterized protein n=1 Tax=Necator americanus TaxID=51031 RepID=A0ABR1D2V8_NECAM
MKPTTSPTIPCTFLAPCQFGVGFFEIHSYFHSIVARCFNGNSILLSELIELLIYPGNHDLKDFLFCPVVDLVMK